MAIKRDLERVTVRLPLEVKDWYMNECTSLGLSMSQYMAFVLVNNQRNQDSAKAIKSLAQLSNNADVINANASFLDLMNSGEFRKMLKEAKD